MPRTSSSLKILTAAVVALTLFTACGTDESASPAAEPTLVACPTGPTGQPPAGQPSAGQPSAGQPSTGQPSTGQPPAGAATGMAVAKTITPSDTSTSTVINPVKSPQIQCGKAEVETHADIVYSTPATAGGSVPLKMDVLVPKTEGPKPLVVYLPGGGFVMAAKEMTLAQRTFVAEAGYVVAGIQYRTTQNGATYVNGVADVKAAIRYLRAHATEYGIDPGKAAVWGDSAGGYLAAMVGTSNGNKLYETGDNLDQSSDVQAVVDKFGASDLSKIASDFDPATQAAFDAPGSSVAAYVFGPGTEKTLKSDPAAIAAADPITAIDAADPAFLLFHGSADKLISPSQTLLLHNALRKAGVDSTRYVIEGAGHGDLAFGTDASTVALWSTQEVMGDITTFLAAHLKG